MIVNTSLYRFQAIKMWGPDKYCMEWKNSRCFNTRCRMGLHPNIRSDLNLKGEQMVFFDVSAGKKLNEAISWAGLDEEGKKEMREKGEQTGAFFLKLGCHELTPFSVMASYIHNRFVSS